MYVEHDTIAACKKHGIQIEAYSPFGRFDKRVVENETIVRISKEQGLDVPKVLLLWGIQNGFIVLPKSVQETRIKSNIELEGIKLSDSAMSELD